MIDLVATESHYLEHMLPVWDRLGELQGEMFLGQVLHRKFGGRPLSDLRPSDDLILVAGYSDLNRVGGRKAVFMEHGAGQSYGGDPVTATHTHYAGGIGRHNVVAFLCPNVQSAARNRAVYPDAIVEVVGSPHLASLQGGERIYNDSRLTVAFAFHTDIQLIPETMNAWDAFWPAVKELGAIPDLEILGHAHPRIFSDLAPTYKEWGVEPVGAWSEIVARADVLVVDNSSVAFEFASLIGPVVFMDAPWYRSWVDHGLRFWDETKVGIRVGDPAGVSLALDPAQRHAKSSVHAEAVERVFPQIEDPARLCAEIVARACEESGRVPARGISNQLVRALRWV